VEGAAKAPMTPAAALLGRRFLRYDRETSEATLAYFAPPEFANRHGSVQGGLLSAMLDSAAGAVVLMELPPDHTVVTLRLDTVFLRPAPLGSLTVVARTAAREGRDVMVEAEIVTDAGTVLTRATVRMRILQRS